MTHLLHPEVKLKCWQNASNAKLWAGNWVENKTRQIGGVKMLRDSWSITVFQSTWAYHFSRQMIKTLDPSNSWTVCHTNLSFAVRWIVALKRCSNIAQQVLTFTAVLGYDRFVKCFVASSTDAIGLQLSDCLAGKLITQRLQRQLRRLTFSEVQDAPLYWSALIFF